MQFLYSLRDTGAVMPPNLLSSSFCVFIWTLVCHKVLCSSAWQVLTPCVQADFAAQVKGRPQDDKLHLQYATFLLKAADDLRARCASPCGSCRPMSVRTESWCKGVVGRAAAPGVFGAMNAICALEHTIKKAMCSAFAWR